MLEQGKEYRIKGTSDGSFFELRDGELNYTASYSGFDIAQALATDNYEEVKQKVKKTFYQSVGAGKMRTLKTFFASNWYANKIDAEKYTIDPHEIIEREFEVEL